MDTYKFVNGILWRLAVTIIQQLATARRGAGDVVNLCAYLQGYFLRNTPNPYLTAFAVVSAPNLVGQLLGPILSATGLYFAGKEKSQQTNGTQASNADVGTTDSSSSADKAK